jgi:Ni,Fe-hydrogenase I small subunit
MNDESLFVGTAEAEHVEMYLKAIWHIKERGENIKINTIAKILNIRQPSVVQMLKKLNEQNLVNYSKAGVTLTQDGERIGSSMMRNSRLLEVLMESALKIAYDSTPNPKIVIAVGACACSGGIFGNNYATTGGIDNIVPVNVYIPGCPPRPQSLLYGILMAINKI